MIKAIIILTIVYVFYRFLTAFVIPKMALKNVERFKNKFKKDNQHIFDKKKNTK